MRIPSFVKSAFLYTAANLLNALIPILLLPVLTHYLTKSHYGLVSLFQVMVMVTLPFAGVNAQGAIEREYFNHRFDFKEYMATGLYILLLSSSILMVLGMSLAGSLEQWLEFPAAYFWIIIAYCFFNNVIEMILSYWRVQNNPLAFGVFRITRTLLEVGLSIYLVAAIKKGWYGRVEGMLLSAGIFAVFAIAILIRKKILPTRFNRHAAIDIIKFGGPLIAHTLGSVIMIYSDRILLTKLVGLEATGSYTVGFQIAMAISLLQTSFNLAWVPWFYKKLEVNNIALKIKIVNFTYIYSVMLLAAVAGLTLCAPFLFDLFIETSYHDAIQFIFWISLGFAFDGMYKMVVNYIFFIKKTYIVSFITIATATLNVVLNYFFIIKWGPIGAAQATALCMFLEFILVWFISNKLYPMPWFRWKSNIVNTR